MNAKLRVAVLFGGESGEHEVSIVSAQAVFAALDGERYEVESIGITRDGQWIVGPGAQAELLQMHLPQGLLGSAAGSGRGQA